jgi:hypothetical protein
MSTLDLSTILRELEQVHQETGNVELHGKLLDLAVTAWILSLQKKGDNMA